MQRSKVGAVALFRAPAGAWGLVFERSVSSVTKNMLFFKQRQKQECTKKKKKSKLSLRFAVLKFDTGVFLNSRTTNLKQNRSIHTTVHA